jgi:hypothetical protein
MEFSLLKIEISTLIGSFIGEIVKIYYPINSRFYMTILVILSSIISSK